MRMVRSPKKSDVYYCVQNPKVTFGPPRQGRVGWDVDARCGDKSTGCHAQAAAGEGSPPARPKEGREEPNPANA